MKDAGIYVHIPFCSIKCIYCDFYSISEQNERIPRFIDALAKEIHQCEVNVDNWNFDTLFIGGGTPGILRSKYIEKIIHCLNKKYDLSNLDELTIEINPGESTKDRLSNFRKIGLNRISIGIQSFNDKLLQFLTRNHSKQQALDTFSYAREVGFENINCELIYSIPNQTIDMWEKDLRIMIDLSPEHISTYCLTVERDTTLFSMVSENIVSMPDTVQESDWIVMTQNILSSHGYNPYEISSFSKKGHKCKHSLHYWRIEPNLGFGPSANGFCGKTRWKNIPSIENYISLIEENKQPIIYREKLTQIEKNNELVGFALRMEEGLDINRISKSLRERYKINIMKQVRMYPEFFIIKNQEYRLSQKGSLFAEKLIPDIIL